MATIYTSYTTSKKIKDFLGESAPEPINDDWWYCNDPDFPNSVKHGKDIYGMTGKDYGDPAAYQLHDLLSKPFTKAMETKLNEPFKDKDRLDYEIALKIFHEYRDGGMEFVERALLGMMEGK